VENLEVPRSTTFVHEFLAHTAPFCAATATVIAFYAGSTALSVAGIALSLLSLWLFPGEYRARRPEMEEELRELVGGRRPLRKDRVVYWIYLTVRAGGNAYVAHLAVFGVACLPASTVALALSLGPRAL
jgi:hypothetical protein